MFADGNHVLLGIALSPVSRLPVDRSSSMRSALDDAQFDPAPQPTPVRKFLLKKIVYVFFVLTQKFLCFRRQGLFQLGVNSLLSDFLRLEVVLLLKQFFLNGLNLR